MRGRRETPGPGQESVWDYPRPPRVDPSSKLVELRLGGVLVARTSRAIRVLETSHPPGWYVPADDVEPGLLVRSDAPMTTCEFKGRATYWDLVVGERRVRSAAWSYETPEPGYERIAGHLCFYPDRIDATVDGERVRAQEGGFYGGWITDDVVGPFKGAPGTFGW